MNTELDRAAFQDCPSSRGVSELITVLTSAEKQVKPASNSSI